MDPAPPLSKFRWLGRALMAFVFCPLLGGAIAWVMLRPVDVGLGMTQLGGEKRNAREILTARIIYEANHNEELPPEAVTDVYAFAAFLARAPGRSFLSEWASPIDPAWRLSTKHPKSILAPAQDGSPTRINPDFQGAPLAVAVALVPSAVKIQGDAPLVWTRGLSPDGTWRDDSPYYGTGGFIASAGESKFYTDLRKTPLHKWGTNEPTSNIREALPPGTRIDEFLPPPEVAAYVSGLKQRPIASLIVSSLLLLLCSLVTAGMVPRLHPEFRGLITASGVFCATFFWFSLYHNPIDELLNQHAVSVEYLP